MAQVPAPCLGEQIVAAVLKSSLVTLVVTDNQGSQTAVWAFFFVAVLWKVQDPLDSWLWWLCPWRSTIGALVAALTWLSHGHTAV